jgi:hypothetical protein
VEQRVNVKRGLQARQAQRRGVALECVGPRGGRARLAAAALALLGPAAAALAAVVVVLGAVIVALAALTAAVARRRRRRLAARQVLQHAVGRGPHVVHAVGVDLYRRVQRARRALEVEHRRVHGGVARPGQRRLAVGVDGASGRRGGRGRLEARLAALGCRRRCAAAAGGVGGAAVVAHHQRLHVVNQRQRPAVLDVDLLRGQSVRMGDGCTSGVRLALLPPTRRRRSCCCHCRTRRTHVLGGQLDDGRVHGGQARCVERAAGQRRRGAVVLLRVGRAEALARGLAAAGRTVSGAAGERRAGVGARVRVARRAPRSGRPVVVRRERHHAPLGRRHRHGRRAAVVVVIVAAAGRHGRHQRLGGAQPAPRHDGGGAEWGASNRPPNGRWGRPVVLVLAGARARETRWKARVRGERSCAARSPRRPRAGGRRGGALSLPQMIYRVESKRQAPVLTLGAIRRAFSIITLSHYNPPAVQDVAPLRHPRA